MQLTLFELEAQQTAGKPTWFGEILESIRVQRESGWPDQFGAAIHRWITSQYTLPRIRTLSLFSGGGGLDIAFHDAGFNIVEMVEIDKRYVETLQANFSEHGRVICADIRDYVPDSSIEIDFIIGGPPCQTFSAAGRRAAGVAGTSDPRGTLFQEYIRLLNLLKPKGFLFENVYGITGAQSGKAWREIQTAFKDAGYNISFRVLDAADYGVPQHRERLFIVGLREGEFLFPFPTHGPDSVGNEPYYSASEAVATADTTGKSVGIGGRYGHLLNDIPPGLNYSFYTKEMGHPLPVFSWRSKFSDFLYKADPDRPVRTIKAQGGQYTGPFSWENRAFTILELKRLQTFPDTYNIVGRRQVSIEQIGNSVPPQLGRMLALSILHQVFGITLPFEMHYLPKEQALGFRQRKRALTELYAQKAKVALEQSHPRQHVVHQEHLTNGGEIEITRFLGRDFAWTDERTYNSTEIHLSFYGDSQYWKISGSRTDSNNSREGEAFRIEVTPAINESWSIRTTSIQLCGTQLNETVFTALWKAFEEKVMELFGIADLVQLSGYYQYQPKIKAELKFSEHIQLNKFWHILQFVTQGIGVGQQLTGQRLALLWECEYNDVLDYLVKLRSMGFEVRSHKTNPQITSGDYLIPYIFPTLTPRSVQLRKSLRERYAR